MIAIPFSGAAKESLDMTLDGNDVTLRVRYAHKSTSWVLDLLDRRVDPPAPLLSGVRIVTGVDMWAPYALGIGSLIAFNLIDAGVDPVRDELGNPVQVFYLTPAEVEALA